MRDRHLASAALIAAAITLSGCYATVQGSATVRTQTRVQVAPVPRAVVVRTAPPALHQPVATRPPAPRADAVWIDGYYRHDGYRWIWVEGHWEARRAGYVWVRPVAEDRDGGVVYHPGYWCPEDQAPPSVYRQPSRHRVAVRPSDPRPSGVRVEGRASGTVRVRVGTTSPNPPVRNVDPTPETAAPRPPRAVTTTTGSAPAPSRTTTTVRVTRTTTDRPSTQTAVTRTTTTTRTPVQTTTTTTLDNNPRTTPTVDGPRVNDNVTVSTRPTTTPRRTTPTVDTPRGVGSPNTPPVSAALTCRLTINRAPSGGFVTLEGRGFTSRSVVRLGGEVMPVARRTATALRFQVRRSAGGVVSVTNGGQVARCGELRVAGR